MTLQRRRGWQLAAGGCSRRTALARLLASSAATAAAAVGGLARAGAASGSPAAQAGLPVLPALRRGLNLTHWFEYEQGQAVPADELRALQQLGLDHVRIPVDPVVGGWAPGTGAPLRFAAALRAAVEQAIAAGLDVVLDLHMTHDTKLQIEDGPPVGEASLAALWRQLGRGFGDLPPARLAFELFNEPQYYGVKAARWPGVQTRLLQAVREHAPAHLVLLSGNEGGSFKGLQGLPLVPAAQGGALAYAFHHYEPFLFTHQGAAWLDTRYTTAGLRGNIRYPARAQAGVLPSLSRPHPRAAQELAAYQQADWGPARIRAEFDAVGMHARQHGVRVVCNEFGVIRARVDAPSRWRWMADVRSACEANGLGWTLWDYTDIFGITAESAQLPPARPRGTRHVEADAVRALGLNAVAGTTGADIPR